ncbi:hypothetical protein BST96_00305 [Oceanicoccus sagamiensis]|uniref:Uncharacterized protein n=2 Tax=Oceanicoccus sagamiensis TaxID=716816 RepID=A0A1X9NAX0_9GAMM|nr:hypothetical protein BST96_00305 [Oceanicoccus sagamiensis]
MDKNSTSAIIAILIMKAVESLGFTPPSVATSKDKAWTLDTLTTAYSQDESLRIDNHAIDKLLIESRLLCNTGVLGFIAMEGLQPAMLKSLGSHGWLAKR